MKNSLAVVTAQLSTGGQSILTLGLNFEFLVHAAASQFC